MAKLMMKDGLREQPNGKVRRSQMTMGYGPGSMIDLIDQAVMVEELASWSEGQCLEEPRLRDRLQQLFFAVYGRKLEGFRLPPEGDDNAPDPKTGIGVKRFPEQYVCSACRKIVKHGNLVKRGKNDAQLVHNCVKTSAKSKAPVAVPSRFVAACPNGHIEDFPWYRFAHQGQECQGSELFLLESKTGDFSGITVWCRSCKATRPLKAAYAEAALPRCRGHRPWLLGSTEETRQTDCEHRLRLLVRTASNAYFTQVMTALSIPEEKTAIVTAVRKHWATFLQGVKAINVLEYTLQFPQVSQDLAGFPLASVMAAIEHERAGHVQERPPIRVGEFATFTSQPLEAHGETVGGLLGDDEDEPSFFARRIDVDVPAQIAQVVVASRLREVRAQVGFTRIDAYTPNLAGEYDLGVQSAPLSLSESWLPAVEIWGEGIFLSFDEDRLAEWESRAVVVARDKLLRGGFDATGQATYPGVRFYMLHSLAHLLITALSLECGYAASSIRERIYCSPPEAKDKMAGILMSTGTPGSEGTLGGLVHQGRRIHNHLTAALNLGRLCSSDPVCASQTPGTDNRHLEGAACHGCLYIAECSCEWFNRYLDRALVVPVLGQPGALAFFDGAKNGLL